MSIPQHKNIWSFPYVDVSWKLVKVGMVIKRVWGDGFGKIINRIEVNLTNYFKNPELIKQNYFNLIFLIHIRLKTISY